MGCSGCKKKKTVAQNMAAQIANEELGMQDKNYVLALYTHPNKGKHGVIGAITKKKYGYRGGGDQFLVHVDDARARPDHFRVIQHAEAVAPTQTAKPIPPPPPRPQSVAEFLVKPPHMERVDVPSPSYPIDHEAEAILDQVKTKGIDLGALPGVTPAIEANLRKAGVVTLDDFKAKGVEGLVKIKFIGKARAEALMAYIESLEVAESQETDNGAGDTEGS